MNIDDLDAIRLLLLDCGWYASDWKDVSNGGMAVYSSKMMRKSDGTSAHALVSYGVMNIHGLRADHSVINLEFADPEFSNILKRQLDEN